MQFVWDGSGFACRTVFGQEIGANSVGKSKYKVLVSITIAVMYMQSSNGNIQVIKP